MPGPAANAIELYDDAFAAGSGVGIKVLQPYDMLTLDNFHLCKLYCHIAR